jgi:hypothetical protein
MAFFTDEYMTDGSYDSTLTQSAQGQLSSEYTAALTAELKSDAVSDYLGFLFYDGGTHTVAEAQAVIDAIKNGDFTLSDLFGAAQSKTGAVDGDAITNPQPTLTLTTGDFAGMTFDLTDILGGLDTETWTQLETTGGAKKGTITTTVYHTREFYTETQEPPGYDPDWANDNVAPTATPFSVDATETLSTYNEDHQITNGAVDGTLAVDLITGHAEDVDGDILHVTGDLVLDDSELPAGLVLTDEQLLSLVSLDGDTLKVDQNSRLLDDLLDGQTLTLTLTYQIDDGHGHTIDNTVTVNIAGTLDEYEGSGEGSSSVTYTGAQIMANGNSPGSVSVDTDSLPDGFDFTFTDTSITATETGLAPAVQGPGGDPAEKVTMTDAGSADWGNPAFNLTSSNTTQTDMLDAGSLDDGTVDFNLNKNQSVDDADTVTVTIDYTYDYWYTA